jgi:thiamine biosynthesis lipoprotein
VGCVILFVALLSGCGGKYEVHREARLLLGTVIEITIGHPDEAVAREAAARAFAEIERVDALLSSHDPGSEVGRLNAEGAPEATAVSAEVFALLERAARTTSLSGGAFDVTIGPVMDLWKFDEGGRVPAGDEITAALAAVGTGKLQLDPAQRSVRFLSPGMKIDLGAIGKGYAVDRAVQVLRDAGIKGAIVDAGGDLRLLGSRPGKDFWRIGVRHPREASRLLLNLELIDTAIVTSGDYERFFMAGDDRYHHLIDPRTGYPAAQCQSVTVIAPEAADADAYATAAFVLGPVEGFRFLRDLPGVEGVIVDAAGQLLWTDREKLGQ